MAVQSVLPQASVAARDDWTAAGPALVFIGVFMTLAFVAAKLLVDPDTHWHIATGAWIWRHGTVPWTDPFSHTFAGAPWIAKEWLSQVVFYAAHRVAGWIGVVAVTAFALALLLATLFAWLAARCRWLLALTLTLLTAALLGPHFLARPHVFAFLPLLVWTIGLVQALEEGRPPRAWLLAILALWANLHGSFTIAYPIAAILALDALIQAPRTRRLPIALHWGAFGLLALVAGCLTPYGIHALLVTFTLFGSGEPLPFIVEWQPIGWTFIGALTCTAAIVFVAGLVAGGWRNAVRIALLVLLTAMLIRHQRFLDVFALVAPVLVVAPLVRRFPDLAPETPGKEGRWPLRATVMLPVAAAASLAALTLRPIAPGPSVTPSAALAAARSAGVTGPAYNSYDFGGFLIAEGVPTFVDGRTDQLFLGGFVSGLLTAAKGTESAPFLDILSRHAAAWAIVHAGGPEARHLEAAPGWTRIHRDETASVYMRLMLRGSLL